MDVSGTIGPCKLIHSHKGQRTTDTIVEKGNSGTDLILLLKKKTSYMFRFRVEICGLREGHAQGSWELVSVAGGKVMTTMGLFPGEYDRVLWACPPP